MSETFLDGRVTLHCGDSRDVLKLLADASIDAVVTDPPYALVSISKRYGKPGAAPAKHGTDGLYTRAGAGFMGQTWDTGETAFAVDFWAQVYRVLKPGGHVVAASSTRTYHRLAVAIEDADFEIRDMVSWLYGSGFPKSHDVSKGIDRALGAERTKVRHPPRAASSGTMAGSSDLRPWIEASRERGFHEAASAEAAEWQGWGTALKPACEPWVLARKPLIGTVVANVLAHGTGALNIDGCRVETAEDRRRNASGGDNGLSGSGTFRIRTRNVDDQQLTYGRWPANVVHDGSDEVVGAFPVAPEQRQPVGPEHGPKSSVNVFGDYGPRETFAPRTDSGSAARFFYSAKADADDRLGSKHPTVKPVDLMQWLCRLVTPPGGFVLDPFAGTGTTGEAAWREGFSAILIEREAEYQADIRRRMALAISSRAQRAAAAATPAALDALPLFREGA